MKLQFRFISLKEENRKGFDIPENISKLNLFEKRVNKKSKKIVFHSNPEFLNNIGDGSFGTESLKI